MNSLNEAIMALGRSVTQISSGRWIRSCLWDGSLNAGCAMGMLSTNIGGAERQAAFYLSALELDYSNFSPVEKNAFRMAAHALVKAAPDEVWETVLTRHKDDPSIYAALLQARAGSTELQPMDWAITNINDFAMNTPEDARRWFSDAIDILAEELPVPERPLFRTEAEQALTLV